MKAVLVLVLVSVAVVLAVPLNEEKNKRGEDTQVEELTELLQKLKARKSPTAKKAVVTSNKKGKTHRFDLTHQCEEKCPDKDDTHDCKKWCEFQGHVDKRIKPLHKMAVSKSKADARSNRIKQLKAMIAKLEAKDDGNDLSDPSTNDVCDFDPLFDCVGELYINLSDLELLYFPVDDTLLEEICSALDDARQCVGKVSGCSDSNSDNVNIFWAGIYHSTAYVCDDSGKKALAGYQDCISAANGERYLDDIFTCLNASFSKRGDTDNELSPEEECTFLNVLLTCTAIAADDVCQSQEFVDTYVEKAAQPELNYLGGGCTLTDLSLGKKTKLVNSLKSLLKMLDY